MSSCYISQHFRAWLKFVNLGFHRWLHISLQIPTWASASIITERGSRSPRKTSIATVWTILIAPVTAREASLCNQLSSVIWTLYTTLHYQIVQANVNAGLITMEYILYTTLVTDPTFYQMCPYRPRKPCRPFSSCFSAMPSISNPYPE